jgi:hypothetical protein
MKYLSLFLSLVLVSCAKNDAPPSVSGGPPSPAGEPSYPSRLTISGVANHGIFDASLAKDSSRQLWMSYSNVMASTIWADQNVDVVATRLAYSNDDGQSWIDSGSINNSLDVTIPLAAPLNAGTWVNEVSSLVYDQGAILSERWKLLWHHYLIVNGDRRFEHGWIGLKMAPTPAALATATEIKLFSSVNYDASNDIVGGPTSPPIGGPPAIHLDLAIHPSLNHCLFSEPGLYSTQSALYVSFLCRQLAAPYDSLIVVLKCVSPCNPTQSSNWAYLGTALNNSDASAAGFNNGYSAPQLAESGGKVFLIATPTVGPGDLYRGCHVFQFSNLETASLVRTAGVPAIVLQVNGTKNSFNGACTFHSQASGMGVIFSEVAPAESEKFRLYFSGLSF